MTDPQLGPEGERILAEARAAFGANDPAQLRQVLQRYPALRSMLDEPIGPFDSPAIIHVSSREMLDVLLEAGADINARSRWWAGGFGILDNVRPEIALYAIERGARVDANAAARLGLVDTLRRLVANDPAVARARGGDGQTPLHVAASVDVAACLLDAGAEIDALDVDHESTPAQYLIKDHQPVVGYLVSRGCRTDLLMAAALGNLDLARRHLDAEPSCVRTRVTHEWFPMRNPKAGGTIYQWTLGFHASAHQVAQAFGHDAMRDLLFERSPDVLKLTEACRLGLDDTVRALRAASPDVLRDLPEADRRLVADVARNNQPGAVRLMLESGWPIDARGQHQATPLHWAAFHGNAGMLRDILRFNPPLEATDADFKGTPLDWAMHGSEHGWYRDSGDYPAAVELLLRAGAARPESVRGSAAVREILTRLP